MKTYYLQVKSITQPKKQELFIGENKETKEFCLVRNQKDALCFQEQSEAEIFFLNHYDSFYKILTDSKGEPIYKISLHVVDVYDCNFSMNACRLAKDIENGNIDIHTTTITKDALWWRSENGLFEDEWKKHLEQKDTEIEKE